MVMGHSPRSTSSSNANLADGSACERTIESTNQAGSVSMTTDRESQRTSARSVSVLGAGAWGTTLAILALETGQRVTLIAHGKSMANHIDQLRVHPVSLPGVTVPASIQVTHAGQHRLAEADVVVVTVPTQKLRQALEPVSESLRNKVILSAVKGLELDTYLRPSEVIRSVIGSNARIAVLSGPNLSTEVANGRPATTVIAAAPTELAEDLVALFHTQRFRVYVSDDVTGVEFGGALKNIIAIGAGIADGLDAGDNAKAAFMTRGIAEIARLGVACGAQPLTFAGLSGIGDLMATCSSPLSRNYRVGVALSQGMSLDEILGSMQEVAEGVPTTKAARNLGRIHGIDLPIVEQMFRVLFEGVSPGEAIVRLMERDPRHELPDLVPGSPAADNQGEFQ